MKPPTCSNGFVTSSCCIGFVFGLSSKTTPFVAEANTCSAAAVLSALDHECGTIPTPAAAASSAASFIPVRPSTRPGSMRTMSTAPERTRRR
jgi:hypothetical protein